MTLARLPHPVRAWLLALAGLMLWACGLVQAGTLQRADVQALFPPPQSVGEKPLDVPAWPIYRKQDGQLQLVAHVFETVDLEPVAGYGGKPLNLLVVLDADGSFRDVRLLSHDEPIFRSAEGNAVLQAFSQQYQGLTVNHSVQVLTPKAKRVVTDSSATLHGILAGTVTATAIDRSILEAAAQVAQAQARAKLVAGGQAQAQAGTAMRRGPNDRYTKSGWNALVGAKLVQGVQRSNRELEQAFRAGPGANRDAEALIRPTGAALDSWVALVSLPQAGRNLLDAGTWMQVRQLREAGTPVLMLLDGGRYPLRQDLLGEAAAPNPRPTPQRWATLRVQQGAHAFEAAPLDIPGASLALSGLRSGVSAEAQLRLLALKAAPGAPALDMLAPLELKLTVHRHAGDGQPSAQWPMAQAYAIPNATEFRPQREVPVWQRPWAQRGTDLAILAFGLLVLTVALLRQGWLTRSPRRLVVFRSAYLVFTLGFIGWWAQGQLTIVSLTSAVEASVAGRRLEFLLADPMAVVLWAYSGLALLVWGRGTFCGWLCPFGALQELISKAVQMLGLRQRTVRRAWDQRLKWVKYGLLAATLGAATVSAAWTEALVEIEPFKTSISLYFQRDWPYVLWAALCVGVSVLVYRGYCRYVCPLGAAFAVLGLLRQWRWIPRRAECGSPCQTCRHRCDYQAITEVGAVQYSECFQCLDCVAIHQNEQQCLPLVKARKAGQRVVPIQPVPLGPVAAKGLA